ncbi:MAG: hypothetical protein ABR502_07180, partial [Chitinophagaceae bacterium]
DPRELERMYRTNKVPFKREFSTLYPELKGNAVADFWNERLNYESDEINWGTGKELLFVIIAALVAGFIAKIPDIFQINEETFYPRDIGFIFLPLLTAYFAWKNNLPLGRIAVIFGVMLISLIYINFLPASTTSDTLILACIHLPLLLWVLLGTAFAGNNLTDDNKRLDFLRYNGDLVIMTGLLVIAGGILTGITIGLFSVIGFQIEKFYFEWIVIFGAAALPIVATYITQTNPQLVNKVSPVIAKIFSPLVLITLVVYLIAILVSGKNPYQDREFLMVFNFLLIGVMAIILFSVAESSKRSENRTGNFILLALSIVTVIVNGIALSAILFRISEWGITPNRLAILGANILMLINLLMITFNLFKSVSKKADISGVENSISKFLPVYIVWVIIVTFIFPLIFNFK